MYWGDAKVDKIETSYINGTGRRALMTDSDLDTHYFAFALRDGNIYFTDWVYKYVCFHLKRDSIVRVTKVLGL